MTTGMFLESWITIEANKRLWLKQVMAYLSLKVDGLNHISLPQIESRIKMLDWVLAVMQVSFPTMEVVMQPDARSFQQLPLPAGSLACAPRAP